MQGPDSQGKAEAASQAGVAWRPQPDGPPYGAGPVAGRRKWERNLFLRKGGSVKTALLRVTVAAQAPQVGRLG